jgi:hypothetical protein
MTSLVRCIMRGKFDIVKTGAAMARLVRTPDLSGIDSCGNFSQIYDAVKESV